LKITLLNSLSSDVTKKGDRFDAQIVEPTEFTGAIIEGHVSLVKRAGRVKGTSELQLAFDRIKFPDGREGTISALVTAVVGQGRETTEVDREGGIKGRDTTSSDAAKIGTATAIGAAIGAIFGGGRGAATGAVIGGGSSTGGVLASRGEDIRLSRGQQLVIKTTAETRVE
jgi:hypothetical protein